MQMQYAKYSKQTNMKPIPANTLQNAQPTNQTNKPPNQHPFSTHHHNKYNNNNDTILRSVVLAVGADGL